MQVIQTLAIAALCAAVAFASQDAPTVYLKNGPYYGIYDSNSHQDKFLGMPYAEPPLGKLRFQNPQPYNQTWSDPKNATEYSPECYGYGSDQWVLGNIVSEDCLTINVIRPQGYSEGAKLPVAFWIHGGGYLEGGARDPRYNMEHIIEEGVKMHKPFIGVSINYRLHGFGFLWGSAVKEAGVANLGLKDQRLALHWVQDNIEKFGGDKTKVTIFGESAGAGSVELQLLAYGGRDDHLFRAAAMQSMWRVQSTSDHVNATVFDTYYNSIANAAGCDGAKDSLDCLRQVPVDKLSNVFNSSAVGRAGFYPAIDGDFLQEADVMQMKKGKFVHVPILHGSNTDEGASFGVPGANTDADFDLLLHYMGYTEEQCKIIPILYPDIPEIGIPSTYHGRPAVGSRLGAMYKRISAFSGDRVIHAGRRYMSEIWAKENVPVYAYDFDVLTNGQTSAQGSSHFQDVVFVFYNLKGEGYENAVAVNPLEGKPASYAKLAKIMSRMWISFFVDQTPNHSGETREEWPVYNVDVPQLMRFETNSTKLAYPIPDTYRAEAIAYLQSIYN